MKERQVDSETPRVPKRDIYIYIQTYNFETVLRDQMPRAKALGNYAKPQATIFGTVLAKRH